MGLEHAVPNECIGLLWSIVGVVMSTNLLTLASSGPAGEIDGWASLEGVGFSRAGLSIVVVPRASIAGTVVSGLNLSAVLFISRRRLDSGFAGLVVSFSVHGMICADGGVGPN